MELLAPAGTVEGFKAVLRQKPDVIYLGAGDMNARSTEAQLALDQLGDLVCQARKQAVKIYFTLNILIKDQEFKRALEIAGIARRAGVAAFIVQDKGLMQALAEKYPDIPLHASTQCSVGSREQILELKSLKVKRVVLARELSLEQIKDLTDYAHKLDIEVEVFTHGATCMSVSGQCHMSFCMGGRSANRGNCAQPCRKTYQLLEGGKKLRDYSALLSPKDLSYFPFLKELAAIKVDALKIEGRLRSKEYQAQVTAIFKTAMEEIDLGLPDSQIVTDERQRNLEIAFNRGGSFQFAFLKKVRNADFLSPDQVNHRGYYLGQVSRVNARQGSLFYEANEGDYLPAPGSQISLKNQKGRTVATAPVGTVRAVKITSGNIRQGKNKAKSKGQNKKSSGYTPVANNKGQEVELQGFHPRILQKLGLPLSVWQQKQPHVKEEDLRVEAKKPLKCILRKVGEAYVLTMQSQDREVSLSSADLAFPPKEVASPLDLTRIQQQLAKLGNTPYVLSDFVTDLTEEDCPSWTISYLNSFRRAAIEKLLEADLPGWSQDQESVDQVLEPVAGTPADEARQKSMEQVLELEPVYAQPTQVQTIINLPSYQAGDDLSELAGQLGELIVLPLEELCQTLQLDPKLEKLKKDLAQSRLAAYLPPLMAWSLPQTLKQSLRSLAAYGLSALVSSTSAIDILNKELDLQLELFLWQGGQVANSRSFAYFTKRGYQGIMISPELTFSEQMNLAQQFTDSRSRPIIWCQGPLEAMFTRFCPIGYSLACGLCRKKRDYKLLDEEGGAFPLTPKLYADCSLEIWHHSPLRQIPTVSCIRAYNFVEESPQQVREILDCR